MGKIKFDYFAHLVYFRKIILIMALKDLSIKDRKILYELDCNSRQTYLQLAKKVGLSKDGVIYRVNKLIKDNIIQRFYPLIDYSKLGYFTVRVYLRFQNSTPEKEQEITDCLCQIRNSLWVGKAEVHWNLVWLILVKSFQEFDNYWLEFEHKFRRYIQQRNVALFIQYDHFPRNYLINKRKFELRVEVLGLAKEEKLDSVEINLLQLLSRDARASLTSLGKALKLSPKTIGYRIKQLERKKIILSYRTRINLSRLGILYYKVDLMLEDLSRITELKTFVSYYPNIIYFERTIGGSDFEFDVECQNVSEFQNLILQLKEKFGECIRDYNYYLGTEVFRTEFFQV